MTMASSEHAGRPRGVLEWRLVTNGDHLVVVRGRPRWCSARARMESGAAGLGATFDTVGSAVAGGAPWGFGVGVVSWFILDNYLPDAAPYLAIAAAVLTIAAVWFTVWSLSEGVELKPRSVLGWLVHTTGVVDTPVDRRPPAARWASAAINLLPALEDAEAFLPDLVRATGEAETLARRLQVPEVLVGIKDVWGSLQWTPDGVAAASGRISQLVRELEALAKAQAELMAKADEPIVKARLDERRAREEDIDNQLALAREAIERETVLRQRLLNETDDS